MRPQALPQSGASSTITPMPPHTLERQHILDAPSLRYPCIVSSALRAAPSKCAGHLVSLLVLPHFYPQRKADLGFEIHVSENVSTFCEL